MLSETSNNITTKASPELLDTYLSYRKISNYLAQRLIDNYVGRDTILRSAKSLGLCYKNTITVNNDSESDILMNHAIYNNYVFNKNAVDRCINNSREILTETERFVLNALQNAKFALLKVEKVLANDGGIIVSDLLRNGRQHLLMDKGLNASAPTGVVLASTVIYYNDFISLTGAALFVNDHKYAILNFMEMINEYAKEFDELLRTKQGYLISCLTKELIHNGASERVRFKDIK